MVNSTTAPVKRSDKISRYLPSKSDWRLLFAVVCIPIHIWAILMFFYSLPAYLMRMTVWTILSILAYVFSLAFIESIFVTAVLTILAAILPARLFREHFVPQGVLVVLLLTIWMIPLHLTLNRSGDLALSGFPIALLPVAWVVSLVVAILGLSALLRRHPGFVRLLSGIAERFTLLAAVYLILDIACLCVVIIRQLV